MSQDVGAPDANQIRADELQKEVGYLIQKLNQERREAEHEGFTAGYKAAWDESKRLISIAEDAARDSLTKLDLYTNKRNAEFKAERERAAKFCQIINKKVLWLIEHLACSAPEKHFQRTRWSRELSKYKAGK